MGVAPETLVLVGLIALALLVALLKLRRWRRRPRKPAIPKNYILIDGSNVMYWEDQTPQLGPVKDVIRWLKAKGYTPGVMFDANVGYLVSDRYQHNRELARILGHPEDQVMVVDKGVPADAQLLKAGRHFGAKIVTNDKFRDWAKTFPEVRKTGHLVPGGYHNGKIWLDFDGSRQRAGKARRKRR